MLNKLLKKYEKYASQIETITDSYLELDLKPLSYDFIVSVMSLHHLLPAKKTSLYSKFRQALVPSGAFVEGDYIVSIDEEIKLLKEFQERMKKTPFLEDGQYHVDIPFSEETQLCALREAGFTDIDVIFSTYRSNIVVAKP
jgi:tRNA (cmo5U34)-methyltransferase